MPNAAMRQVSAGLPVRLDPPGSTYVFTGSFGQSQRGRFAAMQIYKSSGNMTVKLWGGAGGVRGGDGASLIGIVNTPKALSIIVGEGGTGDNGHNSLGDGQGGLGYLLTTGRGGAGTSLRDQNGTLIGLAGGGGGGMETNAYAYGGHAGDLASGAGRGGLYSPSADTVAANGADGSATSGGNGGTGSSLNAWGGGGGGAGVGHGAGGGGGGAGSYPGGAGGTSLGDGTVGSGGSNAPGLGGKGWINGGHGADLNPVSGQNTGAGGGGYGGGGSGGYYYSGGGGGGSFVNSLTILRAGVDTDTDRAGAGQASLSDGAHGRAVIIY